MSLFDEGKVEPVSPSAIDQLPVPSQPLQQVKTPYVTAVQVQRARDMVQVEKDFLYEASQLDENAFYAWGEGKDHVEGPSIELALAAVRCYGNCAVDQGPVEETYDAYIFTSYFIDLERGTTLPRKFRQSKDWKVYGRLDDERKADIRFQIGQSKANRNVILNGFPHWLMARGIEVAKRGVRTKIEEFIEKNSIEAARQRVLASLLKVGVDEPRVLAKLGRSGVGGITVEDLVRLQGDFRAIEAGAEPAATLFPKTEEEKVAGRSQDLKERLAGQGKKPDAPRAFTLKDLGLAAEKYVPPLSKGDLDTLSQTYYNTTAELLPPDQLADFVKVLDRGLKDAGFRQQLIGFLNPE
jgi:hypothetical protein